MYGIVGGNLRSDRRVSWRLLLFVREKNGAQIIVDQTFGLIKLISKFILLAIDSCLKETVPGKNKWYGELEL